MNLPVNDRLCPLMNMQRCSLLRCGWKVGTDCAVLLLLRGSVVVGEPLRQQIYNLPKDLPAGAVIHMDELDKMLETRHGDDPLEGLETPVVAKPKKGRPKKS